MPDRVEKPPDHRPQRRIAIVTTLVMTVVYLSLIFALRWAPGMKDPLHGVIVATLLVPVAVYLLSLPAIFLSERFHRWSGPFFAAGLGLVIASLIALPFLASPPPP